MLEKIVHSIYRCICYGLCSWLLKTLRKEYEDVKYDKEKQECLEHIEREKRGEHRMCIVSFNLEWLATIRCKLEKIFKFDFESADDTQILERSENFTLVENEFKNFTDTATEILKGLHTPIRIG